MSATDNRRQGDRRRFAGRGQGRDASADLRARSRAGTGGRPRRRQCGEQNLCREQIARRDRSRHAAVRLSLAGAIRAKPSCIGLVHNSMPIRRCMAFWCSCRCRRRSMPRAIIAAHRSATRTSTDFIRSMPAGWRRDCRRWCHARRSAASSSPRPSILRLPVSKRWWSAVRNIVGKPLSQLLLAENATVTVAHSRTRDLPELCRRADLMFAAIGRAELMRGDWIKPGATVIDVGINRVARRRQIPHRRRCVLCGSGRGRGRHHAGARRRRADDDRLPAGQYAARGLHAGRTAGAGCLIASACEAAFAARPSGNWSASPIRKYCAMTSVSSASRRRLYRARGCRISPDGGPPPCRRARDRTPPRFHSPTAPTRSAISARSAPDRGARR